MKSVLFAAATAMMIAAGSPVFATSPDEEDAYQGYSVCPPAGECHVLKEHVVLPNGHVVYLTH